VQGTPAEALSDGRNLAAKSHDVGCPTRGSHATNSQKPNPLSISAKPLTDICPTQKPAKIIWESKVPIDIR
jgi:hypothetical protein